MVAEICRSADAVSAVRQTRAAAKQLTLGVMEQVKHLMTMVGAKSLRAGSPLAGETRRFSRLDRRRFLRIVAGLSLGTASLGALAACQTRSARPASKRLPLIGYFAPGPEQADRANAAALREGLVALGYGEGQTIKIESRYTDNDPARTRLLAQELVDLHPRVIVVRTPNLAHSLLGLTSTIPIVLVQGDVPGVIAQGLIKSQAHPGGTLTGLLFGGASIVGAKRLDLLHEAVPGATRLATLRDAFFPNDSYGPYPAWTSHVSSLSISGPAELEEVFARFQQDHAELLAFDERTPSGEWSAQVAEQTRRHRLPAIGGGEEFAPSGGLMVYGADLASMVRGAGRFVDKILNGANPGDLAVELPTVFRFVINKATANELGLTIPPAVLAQATEVLQ